MSGVGSLQMGAEYSKVAIVQKVYNSRAATLLVNEIKTQFDENPDLFKSETPYNIADLGCADGVNSIPLLKALIERIRDFNPGKPIAIYLNDTPQCDLSKAMRNIDDVISKEYKNIYIYSCGKSFYGPLFPVKLFDLIYCLTSVHMLSEPAPCIHDHWIFFLSDDIPVKNEMWVKLGEKDWNIFLQNREAELKEGGRLYVSTHTINKENTVQSKYMLLLSKIGKDLLRNLLKKYEWNQYEKDLTIAVISRKLENYKLPFVNKTTNLEWVMDEINYHKDPAWEKMKTSIEQAKELVESVAKAYYAKSFQAILEKKKENEAKISSFLKEFCEIYAKETIEAMKNFTEDYTSSSIAMIMKKH